MKKYLTIIICIIIGIGFLCIWFTCTDFDAWEAAGIERYEPGPTIFWIDRIGTIWNADMNNTNQRYKLWSPGGNLEVPRSIIVDPENQTIYWSLMIENGVYEIHKANYQNTEPIYLYEGTNSPINSIAMDYQNQMLYFSEGSRIYISQADGTGIEQIYDHGGGSTITDIALDLVNRWVYYATNSLQIHKVNMNLPPEPESYTITGPAIYKFAFDKSSDRIIWTNEVTPTQINALRTSNFGEYDSVTNECFKVLDLFVDPEQQFIYWLEEGNIDFQPPPHGIFKKPIDSPGGIEEVMRFSDATFVFAIDFLYHIPE